MNPSSSSSSVKKSRSELPDLPVDLIVREIISRLPVDQVLDCRFVCKTWFRTISSSIRLRFFIQNNLPHQLLPYHHFTDQKYYPSSSSSSSSDGGDNTKIGFLVGIEEEEDDEYSMVYKEYNEGVISTIKRIKHSRLVIAGDMFVGSRNGLICIAKYIFGNPILYICNPVTRECLYLPEITSPELTDSQVFGFGYNATSKEYKAVRIVYPKTENGVDSGGLVQVYTLGGRSGWRGMGTVASYFGEPKPGAFVDGALHWLDREGKVWALDMADEKFRMLTVSRHTGDGNNMHFGQELVVLGGWLSILEFHPDGDDDVQIWSFKKANAEQKLRSWSPEYSIEYDDYLLAFGLTNKGQLLCLKNYKKICLCDAEHMHDLEETPEVFYGMLHVNTFISLRDLGEEGVKVIHNCNREFLATTLYSK